MKLVSIVFSVTLIHNLTYFISPVGFLSQWKFETLGLIVGSIAGWVP